MPRTILQLKNSDDFLLVDMGGWKDNNGQNSKVGLRKRFSIPINCAQAAPNGGSIYKPPHSLMPPHVAPLHALYYEGGMFPELKGKLIMSWHGHQPTGKDWSLTKSTLRDYLKSSNRPPILLTV